MKRNIFIVLLIIPFWSSLYAQIKPMNVDIYYSKPNELTIEILNLIDKEISLHLVWESNRIDFEVLSDQSQKSTTERYVFEGNDSMRVWISLLPHTIYALKHKINPKDKYNRANIKLKYYYGAKDESRGFFEKFSDSIDIAPYSRKLSKRHGKYPYDVTLKGDTVYTKVDQKPEYPGGEKALFSFITKKAEKYLEPDVLAYLIIRVVIEKDGSISHPYVTSGSTPYHSKAALDIIKLLPKFTPGYYKGKAVRTFYDIGVPFKLT